MADGKWISDLTATTPLVDAARRVLTARLEVVHDYLGRALREPEKDPEYVHQLRVGTRRAGAAIEIFAQCLSTKVYKTTRKKLKQIRRAAGEARDWDVFLGALQQEEEKKRARHRAGLDFLLGHALTQRVLAQTHLQEACAEYPFDFERLLAETLADVRRPVQGSGNRTLRDLAGPQLLPLWQDLEQVAAGDLREYAQLHRVRILGKRLRYAMEVFAACFVPAFRAKFYPAVEEMQEILGRANDSFVASQRLDALRDSIQASLPEAWKRLRTGIDALLRQHQERLPQERQHFLEWWQEWQQSGGETAFASLLRTVQPLAS
jgi:CHAD domain-containing protein